MTIYGSVCSGIEAVSCAWEPLGFAAAWFSEIEPFPCAVLAHHYPHVVNTGDMMRLPDLIKHSIMQPPDILVGGTPCQSFSMAGLRKGMDDKRGQLSLTYVEIANEIDKKRKGNECVTVWENVQGVLSDRSNGFGCFIGALAGEILPMQPPGKKWTNAGIVLGPQRNVAWRVLDSQYFGVAQRRRRVFVIASARQTFDPSKVLFEHSTDTNEIERIRYREKGTPTITCGNAGNANSRGVVLHDGVNYRSLTCEEEEARQGFTKGYTDVAHGVSNRSKRYKAIGNSMTVNVMAWLGKRIKDQLT